MTLADQMAHAIHAELGLKGATQRSVAALYAVAVGAARPDVAYWMPINEAIAARFGAKGRDRVKTMAWEIHNAAAQRLAALAA